MNTEKTQPLIAHLMELRSRILKSVICVLVVFLCLAYFANDIYHIVALPLISQLPSGASMIAINIAAPFIAPIKLTALVALFLSIPYLLYQLWAFIAPALYQHEKRLVYPLLFSSSALFYTGVIFAYYIVFPLIFSFLTKTAPQNVTVATDISSYLDFVLTLFLAFGICFEIPIVIILLCWTGISTVESLASKRPYVIVGAFIVGMLLTPPDVFSQTLLAIPMWLLFELGLLCVRFFLPPKPTDANN